jgi:hypothetical protein
MSAPVAIVNAGSGVKSAPDADAGRSPVGRQEHHGGGKDERQRPRQAVEAGVRHPGPFGRGERRIVVRAETGEPSLASGARFPAIQLAAQERDRLPERPSRAGDAAALQLHRRGRDLHDAGVEVHGGAVRQVVRRPDAVHQRHADEAARIAEQILWARRLAVDHQRELRLQADRGVPQRILVNAGVVLKYRFHRRLRKRRGVRQ